MSNSLEFEITQFNLQHSESPPIFFIYPQVVRVCLITNNSLLNKEYLVLIDCLDSI